LENEELPIFVYGTLRLGQPNYERYLAKAGSILQIQTGFVTSARLYNFGPYPGLLLDPNIDETKRVYGEVMWLNPLHYQALMHELDELEGLAEGLYERHPHLVFVGTNSTPTPVQAWVYTIGPILAGQYNESDLIFEGDWLKR
jgi:gamma-glutamylcyclotransferase (GGCT)/AIG2-like uncharacterized protein YtfP